MIVTVLFGLIPIPEVTSKVPKLNHIDISYSPILYVNISYIPNQSVPSDSLVFIMHENATLSKCIADGLLNYNEKKRGNKLKSIVLYFKQKI